MYSLQENPDIHLLHCDNCGAVSASRIPSNEALSEYYQTYCDRAAAGHQQSNITFDNPDRLVNHIFHRVPKSSGEDNIRILDFGGGDGTIALGLAKRILSLGHENAHVCLVDFYPPAEIHDDLSIDVEHCRSLKDVADRRFDVVIASAIIQHLPCPLTDLRMLFAVLDKNGLFYARTPAFLPLMRVASSLGMRMDFSYPAHLHDLGQRFWDNVLRTLPIEGGLEMLLSRPAIAETTISKHPFRTMMAYSLKAPWYLLGAKYTFVGGWEVFITRK